MKKRVLTTAALGLLCTALITTGVYMAIGPDVAWLVGGFFIGVTIVATWTDAVEHRQIEQATPPMHTVTKGVFLDGAVETEVIAVDGEPPAEVLNLVDPHRDGSLRPGDPLYDLLDKIASGPSSTGAIIAVPNPETGELELSVVEDSVRPNPHYSEMSPDELKEVLDKWSTP